MARYKEKRSTESSLPGGAGETLYVTEIEDTTTGKIGKSIGWTRDKADRKAWNDLKRK
uniref:Uncharacterized protein n=1 Tax=Candidatus Methanogaster sp. ANME-2c ERB4 TaxID=2759911 RepID=A0A7G9YAF7_9EURY|nr:hypothetical protein FCKFGMDP_00002 [Methanosarcinales archaeon ANME-2c ERB4]QNO44991.1 hypothetical protein EEEAIAPH_00011 [Methanosarcinales archaeon ANME-2c ERB4]QNO45069.1 hypothetical protein HIABLJNJ_00006 [Methanosarcinales archaeon ANME-2c ERB4]QNO50323.1 hypothetical protein LKNKCGOP_00001 [Methanosarcinales archaeon ANME-2c ERB4]